GGRARSAGEHGVRGPAGFQPGPAPARPLRGADPAAAPQRGGAYREPVLPAPDLRAVPPRPDHRFHRGGPDVGGRRAGLPAARPAGLRPRRAPAPPPPPP